MSLVIASVLSFGNILKHSFGKNKNYANYSGHVMLAFNLLGVVIFWVDVILFLLSYIKAKRGVQVRHKLNSVNNAPDEFQAQLMKKAQEKLMKAFGLMFIGFVLGFAMSGVSLLLAVIYGRTFTYYRLTIQVALLLFGLSSIFNPLLTMHFQTEFNPCRLLNMSRRSRIRNPTRNVQESAL